ncbi:DUF742 domain-containing protein [Pseudonocardia spinosispora]|uniref:DUF742 domain-containing protein n=1 Tax=Pseudonocardia spinosispora TaxID=103441 RepID=UPI0003F53D6B|nr:DUF742 domain-containing protein [Pseudonocardia spinosispora]
MAGASDRPIGMTGARFGRVERRTRPAEPVVEDAAEPVEVASTVAVPVGMTGARFARPPRRRRGSRLPAPEPAPAVAPPRPPVTEADRRPTWIAAEPEHDDLPESDWTVRVRPYVLTGGRTRSQLPLEALITSTPGMPFTHLGGEHRAVVRLCQVSQSVAEVAARLGVPLGVARVLVDDLAASRAVTVHQRSGDSAHRPDLALLERVLAGLHRL